MAKAIALFNSTRHGMAATPKILRHHRTMGGLKVGDGVTFHVVKYLAWLLWARHGDDAQAAQATLPLTRGKQTTHAKGQTLEIGEWIGIGGFKAQRVRIDLQISPNVLPVHEILRDRESKLSERPLLSPEDIPEPE